MTEPQDEESPADDSGHSAKAAAILGAIFALTALGFYGPRTACSVLIGAAIAVANLLTMRAIIRALVQVPSDDDASDNESGDKTPSTPKKGTSNRAGAAWGLFAAFKILILFGGVWILLTKQIVDPMPLVVGYGVLPLGITASALWSSLRRRG